MSEQMSSSSSSSRRKSTWQTLARRGEDRSARRKLQPLRMHQKDARRLPDGVSHPSTAGLVARNDMDLFARGGGARQCIQNAHLIQAIQRRDIQLHFAL